MQVESESQREQEPLCNQSEFEGNGKKQLIYNFDSLIDNDFSLQLLVAQALNFAQCGAQWVCPSDMMDGRVSAIRQQLDRNGFFHVGILSYTSKKQSGCMYSPFRDQVASTFKGTRERYQQPVGSKEIQIQSLERDLNEG